MGRLPGLIIAWYPMLSDLDGSFCACVVGISQTQGWEVCNLLPKQDLAPLCSCCPPPLFKSEANKCLVFKDFYFFHYLQLIYMFCQLLYSKVSQSYICIHAYMTIYVLLYILYL